MQNQSHRQNGPMTLEMARFPLLLRRTMRTTVIFPLRVARNYAQSVCRTMRNACCGAWKKNDPQGEETSAMKVRLKEARP